MPVRIWGAALASVGRTAIPGSINTIADRAIMLSGGRVLASGTLAEMHAHHAEEVQAFFKRERLGDGEHESVLAALEGGG